MDKWLIFVLIVATLILGPQITGFTLLDLLRFFLSEVSVILRGEAGKRYVKNRNRFAQMTSAQKRESKRYRYYTFLNEILLDMGWRSKSITVEGINVLLQSICIILVVFLMFSLDNALLAIILGAVSYVTLVALLFLLSRLNHMKRKEALMDAENMLCSNMSEGLVTAVESSVQMFDALVQAPFKQFLDEIYNRNIDIETAIEHLNANCGEQFDLFCDKAKTFERERRPGMENVFQYNITKNAYIRNLDRDCAKVFGAMNKDYLLSLSILFGFVMYTMLTYSEMIAFYTSSLGKVLLSLYFIISALVFIYLQFIQSKPFRYGDKAVGMDVDMTRKYEDGRDRLTDAVRWIYDAGDAMKAGTQKRKMKKEKPQEEKE